jgi:RNA polymerase sigma-70 factor (ECF subfamily)
MAMDTTSTDADALDRADMERLQRGQDMALDDLMGRHATGIFQFLCRMLANEDDAHDLAQETFVRVFRAKSTYRTNQRFSTWLYTIAANLARNHIRWRMRHPNVSLNAEPESDQSTLADSIPSDAPTAREETLATERHAAVRAAVDNLPEDLREAIVLCEWEDLSVADAAAVAKTTPKAIESRLYRARQFLRAELKQWL